MIYLEIFLSFIYIGLCSFGGGLATLSLIQQQIVENKQWLTMTEFTDIITLSEMTPGPVAINAATFVGMKLQGIIGAVIATAGFVIPAICIVLPLAVVYKKFSKTTIFQSLFAGIRPAVVGMIISAAYSIISLAIANGIVSILILAVSFILLQTKKVSPIVIIILTGITGAIVF